MALTKVSYSMITGAPANIMDYGASPSASAAVNTAAIQQCINENQVVYIPKGVFQISGPITLNSASVSGGQRTIFGDSRERSVIQATTSNSRLENNVLRHDAIVLENFTFDGNDIATGGVSLGVNASVGVLAASSADVLSNFRVVRCVSSAVVMNYCQYFVIENCLFSGTTDGFGLYLNECGSAEITNLLTISNKTGMFIGGTNGGTNPGGFSQSSYINITNWRAYGPYSGAAEGYLYITNAHHLTFNGCAFEHEIAHSTPLVWIRRTSTTVTSDIVFNYCDWQGLPFNTDLIEVGYCRRAIFNGCSAIRPNSGYYVLKATGAGQNSLVFLTDCLANVTYSDFDTTYWKQGGYTTGNTISETQTLNFEQNWSPVLKGSVSDPTGVTYSGGTTGRYFRTANIATFQMDFSTVAWTGAGSGQFIIDGLPADTVTKGALINVQGNMFAGSVVGIVGLDNNITLYAAGSNTTLTWADATSSRTLVISGSYMVS
jgi:hypothetical protein